VANADVPDSLYACEWGHSSAGIPELWKAGVWGQGVVVAVLDSGIDGEHPDLVGRRWVNPDPDPFVQDRFGRDFVDDDGDPSDPKGHGTHVAGIIAASKDGQGIVGVAPEAQIMAVRCIPARGAPDLMACASAIAYAALHGAKVINCSWGFTEDDAELTQAVRLAWEQGAVVVAAAGNIGEIVPSQGTPVYPAWYSLRSSEFVAEQDRLPNVISVLAVECPETAEAQKEVFMTGGSNAALTESEVKAVDLGAPGGGIWSTVPRDLLPEGFGEMNGTSMSTAYVSGAVALFLCDPGRSHDWDDARYVRKCLREWARPVTGLAGLCACGGTLQVRVATPP
jgi:subtilisin family serine protease